jgi:hypothetical protein
LVALRLGVERRNADDRFEQQQQHGGEREAEQRRQQQRLADFLCFQPIDPRRAAAAMQQIVPVTGLMAPLRSGPLRAGSIEPGKAISLTELLVTWNPNSAHAV